MDDVKYDPRYLEGIRFFNDCDFFEAHDAWEELWADYHGPSRRFYQGLIQVAVCLHHFCNGNIRGAKKLFFGCQTYLDEYRPLHEDLNVDKLLSDLTNCCAEIVASDEEFPALEIDPELIPEIHLATEMPSDSAAE